MGSKIRQPVNGEVVQGVWVDGKDLVHRIGAAWFRWDRNQMQWNPSPAPTSWGPVFEGSGL